MIFRWLVLLGVIGVVLSTFEQYMERFGRTYTGREKDLRREIYNLNLKLIKQYNQEGHGTELGTTRWTDRFERQIKDGVNLKFSLESRLPDTKRGGKLRIGVSEPPWTFIDWRQKAGVTPVREQGKCGACWAFVTTASVESDFYIKTSIIMDLSQEFILECLQPEDNNCEGGYYEDAYAFIQKRGGMPLQQRYPYKAGQLYRGLPPITQGICTTDNLVPFKRNSVNQTSVDINYFDNITDSELQKLILDTPVAAHVASDNKFFHYKNGLIFCEGQTKKEMINHGVLIVGFNSTGRYYIVKNSWGTKWGMEGFGFISYDGDCGLKKRVYTFEQMSPVGRPVQFEKPYSATKQALPQLGITILKVALLAVILIITI